MTTEALKIPTRAKARLELAKETEVSNPTKGRTRAEIEAFVDAALADRTKMRKLLTLMLLKFNSM